MNALQLKPIEVEVMDRLARQGEILISTVPDTAQTDVLGTRTAGRATYGRLIKQGLVYQTEEDPMFPEDGPTGETWTPSYGLTEEGRAWVATYRQRLTIEASPVPAPRARRGSPG